VADIHDTPQEICSKRNIVSPPNTVLGSRNKYLLICIMTQ